MAGLAVRRSWARGVLVVVLLLIVTLAPLRPGSRPAAGAFFPSLFKSASAATPLPQAAAFLPPGAAECPLVYKDLPGRFDAGWFDAGARGTPLTTCPFVEQVRRAYVMSPKSQISPTIQLTVVSPTTRNPYEMQCTPAENDNYVTCTGGQDAIIYLYHTS
jgi:serine/threonine kinase PknH